MKYVLVPYDKYAALSHAASAFVSTDDVDVTILDFTSINTDKESHKIADNIKYEHVGNQNSKSEQNTSQNISLDQRHPVSELGALKPVPPPGIPVDVS